MLEFLKSPLGIFVSIVLIGGMFWLLNKRGTVGGYLSKKEAERANQYSELMMWSFVALGTYIIVVYNFAGNYLAFRYLVFEYAAQVSGSPVAEEGSFLESMIVLTLMVLAVLPSTGQAIYQYRKDLWMNYLMVFYMVTMTIIDLVINTFGVYVSFFGTTPYRGLIVVNGIATLFFNFGIQYMVQEFLVNRLRSIKVAFR